MSTNDSGPFDSEEALDWLLGRAQWPEPPAERLERLRASWRRMTGCRVRGAGYAGGLMAVAAGLLLAAGAACWRWVLPAPEHGRGDAPVIASVEPAATSGRLDADDTLLTRGLKSDPPGNPENDHRRAATEAADSKSIHAALAPQGSAAWVRAPNRLEQTLALSAGWPASGRPRLVQSRANNGTARVASQSLKPAISAALARWGLDRETLSACAGAVGERCEINVLRFLRDRAATTDAKIAAIGLLALIGSPRSIPPLIEHSRRSELHGPAVAVLARLAGPGVAAELAAIEPDAALRRRLWAEALRRASPNIVSRYLYYVEQGDTAALAAITDVRHPPLEALFFALESPRVPRRLAAARALGHVENPDVARRLSHYVLENVSRQEALVALLTRRDRYAAAFIEQARDDLRLMAVVGAAEGQLNSFTSETWR